MIIPLGHCGGVQDRMRHEEFVTFRFSDSGDTWGAKNKQFIFKNLKHT